MKADIHPTYYHDAKITCACGATYITGSTRKEIHVDTCSNCHPFYTGKQKLIDTAGTLEKFKKRAAKTTALRSRKARAKA
ncbi:MAG: 50S ribosomal protein L31 [Candidatus Doudnabacteria bacterium RIFCSPHIGHO2_01_FULL_50_11]|uniref:Large ribosomal subunit protein bL31 n=1 Tax=Candidatus Doudnabacteria bacterium RIFCSPHIGHO2_01_FULL_50_11 TaxID=1817828 RepID=A0A1F5PGC4_9BACT|nr:MAG: 50S ribosomal protein L31 [Candidatus Doudnabacteria bacterium RIFCSPHIGHO2_01_FULL_50_11]